MVFHVDPQLSVNMSPLYVVLAYVLEAVAFALGLQDVAAVGEPVLELAPGRGPRRSKEAGFDRHLVKPVVAAELTGCSPRSGPEIRPGHFDYTLD